ncbi:MAG: DoxX family protein [Muribaculaceae bacterium]|nr:DoxX family protein [Muribaculaceae bacterium]
MTQTASEPLKKWKVWMVWTLRIVVGALFIYSGFVKLIDLWGFIYKIEEYLGVWGFTMPRSVNLVGAILLSTAEFVSGVMLLTGCYKRSVVWFLTAMMAFLLPLTAYIYFADPVSDCGCFGDAFIISNGATFLKNIVLTAMLVFLCIYNNKVKQQLFLPEVQWIPLVASCWFAIELGLICYNVQPLIDFRQYPEGSPILRQTDMPDIRFIYTRGDETQSFSADNLPTDTAWHFVERVEPAQPDLTGQFTVFDGDEDVTEDVISDSGQQIILVIPELVRADVSYTYFINDLVRLCKKHDIDFIALIATDPEGISLWVDFSLADYNCYSVDDTQLKELVRGNMALVYIDDGIIKWKRTVSSFAINDLDKAEQEYGAEFPDHLIKDNGNRLMEMVRNYLIFLAAFAALQWLTVLILRRKRRRS